MPRTGKATYPVDIRVKIFGNELEQKIYSNLTVKEFVADVAAKGNIEMERLKVKILDDVKSVRIDTQFYEKETMTLPVEMRVLNTLADMKVS